MNNREFASFADTDRAWTYDTPYDLAERSKILQNEGKNSQRFQQIENYIDYINNEMSDGYRVSTQVTEKQAYRPYASGVSRPTTTALLYRRDERGQFVEYRRISRIVNFIGDEIVMQDDDVFIMNNQYEVAVRPIVNKSVDMINIDRDNGGNQGYSEYMLFDCRVREFLHSQIMANRAIHQHYVI